MILFRLSIIIPTEIIKNEGRREICNKILAKAQGDTFSKPLKLYSLFWSLVRYVLILNVDVSQVPLSAVESLGPKWYFLLMYQIINKISTADFD